MTKDITFKDDNAVSRLSVRDIIYANAYELEYPDGSNEYVVNRDELIKYLMELPSVTPQEPKTGHWITTRTFMHDGEFYCDKCKCDAPHNEKWNYCPNCGAKMKSEDKK